MTPVPSGPFWGPEASGVSSLLLLQFLADYLVFVLLLNPQSTPRMSKENVNNAGSVERDSETEKCTRGGTSVARNVSVPCFWSRCSEMIIPGHPKKRPWPRDFQCQTSGLDSKLWNAWNYRFCQIPSDHSESLLGLVGKLVSFRWRWSWIWMSFARIIDRSIIENNETIETLSI